MGKMRPMRPTKPAGSSQGGMHKAPVAPMHPQGLAPRPQVVPPRPAMVPLQRGASQARAQARETRRESLHLMANQQLVRPRETVRPAGPPLKVMPKQPAPVRPTLVRPGMSSLIQKPPMYGQQTPTPSVRPTIIQKPAQAPKPTPRPSGLKASLRPTSPAQPAISRPVVPGLAAAAGAAALGTLLLNKASAHPQIATEVSSLDYWLSDLRNRSSFTQIQTEVTELDANLNHALNLLESARDKGYVYQRDLDDIAYQAMDRWQPIRDQVLQNVPVQATMFKNNLTPLANQVAQLNSVIGNPTAATPILSSTSSQVNGLVSDVSQIESSLRSGYTEIMSQVSTITSRLNAIHWTLGQLAEAKFRLPEGENLVMAVAARWDKEGDDDPEGILYLTNKRLIYERKEKVATKKVLFITVAKELVHEVLIDQPLSALQNLKAANKGLFGHQDFLEVGFTDARLGLVPFHLNGQNCTEWVTWIEKAKSGEIEKDVSTGSGLSYADLTGPLTSADLIAIQGEVNNLQDVVTLKGVRGELANIENDMRSLERKLANLRACGYVIEKSLEADVAILATQWERIKTNAEATLENQTRLLSDQMSALQRTVAELLSMSGDLKSARPVYMQVKSAIASTEAQADAADDVVIAQYDQYADEVESLTAHLEWVGWMLDALSTASFQLMATESGVAATECVWGRPGFEPENGILFLTDQRLLWEDRVDTFELKLDVPFQQVNEVKKELEETSGQEFLAVSLGSGAPYPSARFQLALPVADSWLKMVGRARAGDYAKDRAVAIDQAELERIRNAPRQCSNCGAGLAATILRGQTQITCEYCGLVIRI